MTYPGRTDADHAWAYLPDLTRAAVQLAEARQGLARFEDIPFPGYTLTGAQMAGHLSAALGRAISVKQMAWWPQSLARLVMPVAKHLLEMRYLWNVPHQLDGSKFARLLPNFQHTPVAHALATAASPVLAGKAKPSGMTAEA